MFTNDYLKQCLKQHLYGTNKEKGMEKVEHLYSENEQLGIAHVSKCTLTPKMCEFENLRHAMHGQPMMYVSAGTYARLSVDGTLMMSDTDMEQRTNRDFIKNAKGDVMIAGLGLGLIIYNLKDKIDKNIVRTITVYEKYQDVIDLILPKFKGYPLRVVKQDILEYKPPKEERYDTIYFDIWPYISYENHDDMVKLHRRWQSHKRAGGWMSSWCKDLVYKMYRE